MPNLKGSSEFEITPEMIDAGIGEYHRWVEGINPKDCLTSHLITNILLAALAPGRGHKHYERLKV